jgi:hypothetical protein
MEITTNKISEDITAYIHSLGLTHIPIRVALMHNTVKKADKNPSMIQATFHVVADARNFVFELLAPCNS